LLCLLFGYRTSDIGSFASTSCSCGRDFKLFQEIEGRSNEYIFTKEGNKISLTGLIFGQHFQAFVKIKKMQIYQEDKGLIEIRIVKSSEFTRNDEEEISKIINNAVPEGLSVTFNYQNEIPLTKRGKHRFLIQEIHDPIPKHIEG
jgi:phenylacetate-CoA ligase